MQVDPNANLVELLITSDYRFEDGYRDGQVILQTREAKVKVSQFDKIVAACRSLAAGIDISRMGWMPGKEPDGGGEYLVAIPFDHHYYNSKGDYKCHHVFYNPFAPDKWYVTNPNTGASEPYAHKDKIVAFSPIPMYGTEPEI